jgi:hypothetical protein
MYLAILIAALVAVFFVLRAAVSAYLEFRGKRVVTCPETKAPAAVEVDATQAAFTAVLGEPELRLKDCSRWPERQNCGQECLKQIEAAPAACLVRTMLAQWYEGKTCVYCGRPFGEINWLDHKPALMNPQRVTIEWPEIRPEEIPAALATHLPVCWNCHLTESFRREHPELILERPWKPGVQIERK